MAFEAIGEAQEDYNEQAAQAAIFFGGGWGWVGGGSGLRGWGGVLKPRVGLRDFCGCGGGAVEGGWVGGGDG